MTFPTIPTIGAGRLLEWNITNTTALRTGPNLNTLTKNSGDLLIAIVIGYQTSTGTNAAFSGWTSGWTEFHDSATSTTLPIGMAYKWSTGSETGAITVTQAGTITGGCVFLVMSIPGAHPSTPPEAGGRASGTATVPTPGALDPAGWGAEDTLWIALGANGETATTGSWTGIGTGIPASYSDGHTTNYGVDAVGAVNATIAFRQLNTSSEDPGNFASSDTSNSRWGAVTIAVRPAPNPVADQKAYRFYADGSESSAVALAAQDTAVAIDVTSGDVNAALRVRVQETAGGTIPSTDDWKVQWERNNNAEWYDLDDQPGIYLASWGFENSDGTQGIGLYVGNKAASVSFFGNGLPVTRARAWAGRLGSPDGTTNAKIYASTGSPGNKVPTGSVLATSTDSIVNGDIFPGMPGTEVNFNFDGTFSPTLNVEYCLVFETTNTGDSDNSLLLATDIDLNDFSANAANFGTSGPWVVDTFQDLCYGVLSDGPEMVNTFNAAALSEGAATTNRLTGGTGTFVAGKISEDGTVDNVGITPSNFTEFLYAITFKQAGLSNSDTIRFKVLRNSGAITYTVTPTANITKTASGPLTNQLVGVPIK